MSIKERFYNRYFGPHGIVTGIKVCLSNEHTASALALVCAGIESMTFLSLPDNRESVTEFDFIHWVKTYMQPAKMGMSARDLWEMRCALISGYVSEKSAQRNGRPRQILFAWGKYSVLDGMELRPGSRWHRIMTIHAGQLYKSLVTASETFCKDHIAIPDNAQIASKRLNIIFGRSSEDQQAA